MNRASIVDPLAQASSPRRRLGSRGARVALLAGVAVLVIAASCGIFLWFSRGEVPVTASASAEAVGPSPAASVSAPASSAPAATLTTRRVGDWVVVCPVDAVSGAGCFLQQQLRNQDKQLVLVWTLRQDTAGLHAVWEVPADIVQERGLIVDIADGKPKGLPFSACNGQVCTARALLAPDYLRSLEAASSVTAAVSASDRTEPVRFSLSAKGLAEALSMLSRG